jgi:P-type E1-E2 ATPase
VSVVLLEDECRQWLDEYNKAASSIKDRDQKLTAAVQNIERRLFILQDGVPETIHKLGQTGIKLWVLTGDKRETAKKVHL